MTLNVSINMVIIRCSFLDGNRYASKYFFLEKRVGAFHGNLPQVAKLLMR
jgi:hypothetical protein